jgi:hypothetical protein
MCVHRRQRVVHQNHVCASIAGPSESHPLLLTAAEIDAPLSNLRLVACTGSPKQLARLSGFYKPDDMDLANTQGNS